MHDDNDGEMVCGGVVLSIITLLYVFYNKYQYQ